MESCANKLKLCIDWRIYWVRKKKVKTFPAGPGKGTDTPALNRLPPFSPPFKKGCADQTVDTIFTCWGCLEIVLRAYRIKIAAQVRSYFLESLCLCTYAHGA